MMGGSAAALYAHHRGSSDHHHVLVDLVERYTDVVEAVEASGGWVTSVRASTPPVYLVVQRNVVRDYLYTVALADRLGLGSAADVLTGTNHYYADRSNESDSVLTTLVIRLSEPAPRDVSVIRQLGRYKGLDTRWQEWPAVVSVSQQLADTIMTRLEEVS